MSYLEDIEGFDLNLDARDLFKYPVFNPNLSVIFRSCALICCANSLVGVTIKPLRDCSDAIVVSLLLLLLFPFLESRMFCTSGIKKANVLPEPVGAQAIMSLLKSEEGIASHWIGVGSVNPWVIKFCNKIFDNLNLPTKSSKEPIGRGISWPVTFDPYFWRNSRACSLVVIFISVLISDSSSSSPDASSASSSSSLSSLSSAFLIVLCCFVWKKSSSLSACTLISLAFSLKEAFSFSVSAAVKSDL